ncbi:YciI family protein [Deinococcus sp. MIMF12]|uniref:YciI family protein n=1 Tax=Deinococcus rhizophilus TaxID=3049544 RepID=A0ABT7JDK0_9DEIO|nr:YciI family protein [Deinococcus rhizophilus]MDL2343122.1 YciI family protein [Deinococcus rhizophilus]
MTQPPTLWVIESTYLKSGDDLAAVTPRHREWLDGHYRSGLFLTSGRKVDGTGGVLLAQAESQEQLEAVFRDDPFVLEGCSEYRYTAFTPVKRGRVLALEGVALVE